MALSEGGRSVEPRITSYISEREELGAGSDGDHTGI